MRGDEPASAEVDRRIAELRHLIEIGAVHASTAGSCSAACRWVTRSSPRSSARADPTRRSTPRARAPRRRCRWPRTGSGPGRCRRVVVVSADDVTSDTLLPWVASGFLASGAAATDDSVEDAATPFDRRRHGMIVGMGAAAFVVESADAARERGLQPICEVLGAVTANSAFHGTRLDLDHIAEVMERRRPPSRTR